MKKSATIAIDEETDALRIMVQQFFRIPDPATRRRVLAYLMDRFHWPKDTR